MSKKRHNLESKLMIVKYVLDEKHSFWEASDFFGVAYQTIRTWVKHYEHERISGLTIKNKGYSGEYITFLAQETNTDQESIKQLSGWSQIISTYFHTDDKHKRKATNEVDKQYEANTTPNNEKTIKSNNVIQFPFNKVANQ